MTERDSKLQRLDELLADRATQGIGPPEALELQALLREFPQVDGMAHERAAALLDLAMAEDGEPLPEALSRTVMRDAVRRLAARQGPATRRWRTTMPWLLAAASIALAAVAWWMQARPGPDVASRRAALLSQASDARVIPWATNPGGVSGDVVWSNARQEGYVRITGLPANDPSAIQYQLWIFDAKRQGLTAVSGGVFDVETGAQVIIPIDAGIKVFQPSLFAVTTEPPGGVVQHDPIRDPDKYKIVLTAPVT